jgi:hypothetical protein
MNKLDPKVQSEIKGIEISKVKTNVAETSLLMKQVVEIHKMDDSYLRDERTCKC